jgi:hypothetical protein
LSSFNDTEPPLALKSYDVRYSRATVGVSCCGIPVPKRKKKNNIRSDRRPQLQRKQDEKDEKERENRKECMFQLGWKGDEPSLIYTIV